MARGSRFMGGSARPEENEESRQQAETDRTGEAGGEEANRGEGAGEGRVLDGEGAGSHPGGPTLELSAQGGEPNGDGDGKKKKGKTDDEKRADFSRLASGRASGADDSLRLLGHLANTSQYLWDEEQEERIFGTLERRIAGLRKVFRDTRAAHASGKKAGSRQHSISV